MFTVAQRDALRERLLRLAEEDERVVAGAAVGSLAVDGGDRFSDLDLTFGIADHVSVADVLDDWARTLVDELDAVHLVDLERGPTTYRVFLLPDALQFDLSMTPAAQFRPAGPRFRLLFGETAPGEPASPKPPVAGDLFGWGVIYALHARACIERGRVWQAEHYVGAVRDHALSLACFREGLPAVQARGYDDLSGESLARFEDAHVGAVEPRELRSALAASVRALVNEGAEARLPHAETVARRLAELHERPRAVRAAGVDLARGALAVVVLEGNRVVDTFRCETFAEALLVDAEVVGVDIQIGLPESGGRAADEEARRFVGARASSVFSTPVRAVLAAPTYAEARRVAIELTGKSISAQSYALSRRILEVDEYAQRDERVIEVHPEVSFRELAHRPLASKHRLEGLVERRALLEEAGLEVPASAPRIAEPDLLDATIVAWTAQRYARGEALPLPQGHRERIGAIWR